MTDAAASADGLRHRGFALEWITLGWNVIGVAILTVLAAQSRSIALVGFGLDSLIEIGASVVVVWELSDTGEQRQRRALRLIGAAFVLLAAYLLVQSATALITRHHPDGSLGGVIWTAITAATMFTLATLKRRTGRALRNPVLEHEGRVTFIDGLLAVAVLIGVGLDLTLSWWWADALACLVIVYYAIREAIDIFHS